MYSIVDIETTGGVAGANSIIEIAILIHDGARVVKSFQSLVNPGKYIPSFITMLTGITNEMVADAPRFHEIAKEILSLTEHTIFVAHSVNFDYSFVKAEMNAIGVEFNRKKLCTVRLSRKLVPGYKSYSLGTLCANIGITVEQRHRAMGDAAATAQLFTKLLFIDKEIGFVPHSLTQKSKEATLPPHINKETFDKLPQKTGVYYFLDHNKKVIYVGKAQNIKQRVAEHFSGNTHTKTRQMFLSNIYNVSYEVTGNNLIAFLLENESIKKHYPRYNRTNKNFQLNYGIYAYEDQRGFSRLNIGKAGKHDKPIIYCKTLSEATNMILAKINQYDLCLRLCGIIKSNEQCTLPEHGFGKRNCMVCHDVVGADVYNARLAAAFANVDEYKSFTIKTKGRAEDEEGIVMVEKGKFLGYGYVPFDNATRNVQELKTYIQPCYDTQDSQSIIQSYLKKLTSVKKPQDYLIYH